MQLLAHSPAICSLSRGTPRLTGTQHSGESKQAEARRSSNHLASTSAICTNTFRTSHSQRVANHHRAYKPASPLISWSSSHHRPFSTCCWHSGSHSLPVLRARSRDQPEFQGEVEDDSTSEDEDAPEQEAPYQHTPHRSEQAEAEVVLFLYQLELDSQLQRMLTYENFDNANDIRKERERIERFSGQLQAAKKDQLQGGEGEPVDEDYMSKGITLQSQLQGAIKEERYAEAAQLRDQLKGMQDAANAAADRELLDRQRLAATRQLRLGQRVMHAHQGFRGLICGWDSRCMELPRWQDAESVGATPGGATQPFYHILIDSRDRRHPSKLPVIAYVAQDCLSAPEGTDSWVSMHGGDAFQHPYCMQLFLGKDENGDYIPIRQLRDKYLQQREDIHPKSGQAESE